MQSKQCERRALVFDALKIQARKEGDGPAIIIGHAAVFNSETELYPGYFERIAPGAFARAIDEKHDVRALVGHDADKLLGRTASGTLTLREDEEGLAIEITPPDTQLARDTETLIARGDLSQMSFAFLPRRESFERSEDGNRITRIIEDVDLFDVSVVTYPAYPDTDAGLRACQAWEARQATPPPVPPAPPEPPQEPAGLALSDACEEFEQIMGLA